MFAIFPFERFQAIQNSNVQGDIYGEWYSMTIMETSEF